MYALAILGNFSPEEERALKSVEQYIRLQQLIESVNELCDAEEAVKRAEELLLNARKLTFRAMNDKALRKKLETMNHRLEAESREQRQRGCLQAVIQGVKYKPPVREVSDSEKLELEKVLLHVATANTLAFENSKRVGQAHEACELGLEEIVREKKRLLDIVSAILTQDIGFLLKLEEAG